MKYNVLETFYIFCPFPL